VTTPLKPGDFAYLRVRVTGHCLSPSGKDERAAVEVVNRIGKSNGEVYAVEHAGLITPADAMRAVRGVK
jgi:hypothetical protein